MVLVVFQDILYVIRHGEILVSSRDGELERNNTIRAVVTLEENIQIKKDDNGVWQFVK